MSECKQDFNTGTAGVKEKPPPRAVVTRLPTLHRAAAAAYLPIYGPAHVPAAGAHWECE